MGKKGETQFSISPFPSFCFSHFIFEELARGVKSGMRDR